MLILDEIPEKLKKLHQQARDMAETMQARLTAAGETRRIPLETDLLDGPPGWVFLHDGFFRLLDGEQPVRFFFSGDLFRVGRRPEEHDERRLCSEFGAELTWISLETLDRLLGEDDGFRRVWLIWQDLEICVIQGLVAFLSQRDVRPQVCMRHFKFGETLMSEGEPADGIYHLVDGEVRVTVRGVEVGRVGAGEILGEISFLTEQPRIATVSARTNCLAQFIGREDFLLMMRYKPQTVMGLARTLAERIARLNTRFVDAHGT